MTKTTFSMSKPSRDGSCWLRRRKVPVPLTPYLGTGRTLLRDELPAYRRRGQAGRGQPGDRAVLRAQGVASPTAPCALRLPRVLRGRRPPRPHDQAHASAGLLTHGDLRAARDRCRPRRTLRLRAAEHDGEAEGY